MNRDFYADRPDQKRAGPSRDICLANALPGNGHRLCSDARRMALPRAGHCPRTDGGQRPAPDLHSRRVIGWAGSSRMTRDRAIRALKMAVALRQSPEACIHPTDRGSASCSHDGQKLLRQRGFRVSTSGKAGCYDNSAVGTFFRSIKAELIWRRPWLTRRQAELPSSNTSTASAIRAGGTQRRAGKDLATSNGRRPEQARGPARKRDRSRLCRTA